MSGQVDSGNFSDDISVIAGGKNELIVFSEKQDLLSFLELLKLNKQNNSRTLVALNSSNNAKKFINRYQNMMARYIFA